MLGSMLIDGQMFVCFFLSLEVYNTVNTIKVMSSRSVNLLALYLSRLRPPKQFTSTKYTFFYQ